jgi:hypothetical protein
MNKRTPLFLLSTFCFLLFPGCTSTNITKLVGALAKDPAIVSVYVPTMYGAVKFVRVGSTTNSVDVSPDGNVKVNPNK